MLKSKIIILLIVFIDVIGIGVIIPILPFYVARFSNSPVLITSLFAVFALFSFFSSPVLGALSDRYGRRPILILSIFSTAIGWFIFAAASNIYFLFLGRIIDGIMAGNLPVAQSYLSDISRNEKERTTNLGLIGAVFGLGLIFGPLLGGLLGKLGHSVPFWFVGTLAMLNTIFAFFTLPETHKTTLNGKLNINPFKPITNAINDKKIRNNYIAWFLFGLAIAGYQSIFSLYMRDIYNFDEFIVGIIFGLIGVIVVINQGLFMKHIWLKYFKEPVLELWMLIVFSIGFLLLSLNVFWVFFIALIFTTFGQSILRVVMTSQVVGFTNQDKRGEVLGIMSSIVSLSMMISPFIAGLLYSKNTILPFIFSAIYLGIAFILLFQKRQELAKEILPENISIESQI